MPIFGRFLLVTSVATAIAATALTGLAQAESPFAPPGTTMSSGRYVGRDRASQY